LYEQVWKPALEGTKPAPNRYKFHATRHDALSSSMLGAGLPLPEVAAHIGDHIETVTKMYAHFLDDAPRTAKTAPEQGPLTSPRALPDGLRVGTTCPELVPQRFPIVQPQSSEENPIFAGRTHLSG
jgi:hypothetical protein